ncbi:flagellar hook-associated protein 2 [Paenibacillus faecis]|uniref:flagellar filament capping protein FliD n=1 Tax=Paenibacillus faecis TaxID=862114 RepID=UPI001B17F068|nr:flagellar filament capping protein FliD [Paenibacillus faecis]GIO86572.1 flagellar hook-associated protein 2 [Paenibacillus faecis]
MGVALTGLASGLNTQSLIKGLMDIERVPYQKLETKKNTLTNNKSIFNSINLKLKSLRDAASAFTDLGSFQVSSAVSSDTSKLTATGGGSSVNGNYTVEVGRLAKQQMNATNSIQVKGTDGKDIKFSADDLAAAKSISIGGKSIVLSDDLDLTNKSYSDALSAIAGQINKQFGDVQASVVQTSDGYKSLVVTAKDGKTIDMSGTGSFTLNNKVTAQPATLKVNGIDITSSSNTVKDAIPGVTLQLLAEGSTVNVEVKQDADKITEKVQTFVDAYNDVVKLIRENTKKIENKKDANGNYIDFKTNLQSDSLLRQLNSELYDIVSGVSGSKDGFRLLSDIGLEIDKGKKSASEMTGVLSFDKDVFKKKLTDNPSQVEELFNGDAGLGTLAKDRIYNYTKANGLMELKRKGFEEDINFIDDEMENMEVRLTQKEERLTKQYTQMEVALSKLKNQQSWMAGQINSLMSSNS